jgi:hypothetical protein
MRARKFGALALGVSASVASAWVSPADAGPLFGVFASAGLAAIADGGDQDATSFDTCAIAFSPHQCVDPSLPSLASLSIPLNQAHSTGQIGDGTAESPLFAQAANATLAGNVVIGTLGMHLQDSISATVVNGFNFQAQASSTLFEKWDDSITIGGPADAPAVIRLSLTLDGTVTRTPTQTCGPSQTTSAEADRNGFVSVNAFLGAETSLSVGLNDCGFAKTSATVDVNVFGGEQIGIGASMTGVAFAGTRLGSGVGRDDIDVAADHTTHFFVDPLTPGVHISSDSGHDFATPVAVREPASLPTLASGVLGVVAFGGARRRRRRR